MKRSFVVALALAGCASAPGAARTAFQSDYTCPTTQVTVTTALETRGPGIYDVAGCSYHQEYSCDHRLVSNGDGTYSSSTEYACSLRDREGYLATDGTLHVGWSGSEASVAHRDAAVASAAHDIPCAAASITAVDNDTLDGCGQRVSYRELQESTGNRTDVPDGFRVTIGERYVLIGRVAVPAP